MIDPDAAFERCPLIAILRGITQAEVEDHVLALMSEGFGTIEVPLNSPQPFDSIERAARVAAGAVIGAGTVLRAEDVGRVRDAGGTLIVSPNFDPRVAAAARVAGMHYVPGIATVTEAFAAIAAGADMLKLFPAEMIPAAAVKAMRAVLPVDARLLPVGGITPQTLGPYLRAGASGFGLGSALYRPGQDAPATATNARLFAKALADARAASCGH